ncbi:MAG TPA: transcription antitermination factor NusB [Actinomycetota bacterium]|nr:transcription antitermination factor NusB [Actinomycetota bacterium]
MSRRRGSRKLALDVLYEHDVSGAPLSEILERHRSNPGFEMTREIVDGVESNIDSIDATITSLSEQWAIDRMPVVDRNLIRIGVYEILYASDVPSAVAIDEAVALAKIYSTEDSGRFVNGLLAAVAKD